MTGSPVIESVNAIKFRIAIITALAVTVVAAGIEFYFTKSLVDIAVTTEFGFIVVVLGVLGEYGQSLTEIKDKIKLHNVLIFDGLTRREIQQNMLEYIKSARHRLLIVQGTPVIFFQPRSPGEAEERELKRELQELLTSNSTFVKVWVAFSVYDNHFLNSLVEKSESERGEVIGEIKRYLNISGTQVFSVPEGYFTSFSFVISDDSLILLLTETKKADGSFVMVEIDDKDASDKLYQRYSKFRDAFDRSDALSVLEKHWPKEFAMS